MNLQIIAEQWTFLEPKYDLLPGNSFALLIIEPEITSFNPTYLIPSST